MAEQTVIWSPQPGPQTSLLECPVFEVFYGGARGGGKTESSIGDWLQHSAEYGEAAIGIFVRRKFKQLAEVIARTKQLFPKIGAKYNEQKAEWRMANGARLKFVYLERDSDAEEYQGHNYTRVYVEEVTNFPTSGPIDKLRATLRSGSGVPVGMRLTGNPGGPGHNWVKARYIDPAPQGYKLIAEECQVEIDGIMTTVSLERVFIPSKLGDNMMLLRNDPTYVLRLRQSGSEALVKAWLEGNWDIVDGAFFTELDENTHGRPADLMRWCPPGAVRFRSFDWGSYRPFSVGWWVICDGNWPRGQELPRDAIFRYREWYGASGPNKGLGMTADAVQKEILEMEDGERIRYAVADPAIFIRNGGPSIAETMARCRWRRADNKRIPGWEQVFQRIKGPPQVPLVDRHGNELGLSPPTPMLYAAHECEDFWRTMPTLQHDEDNGEDLDTDGEDHVADEVRYGCMSRPWQPKLVDQPRGLGLPKLPGQMTVNDVIARNKAQRMERDENARYS